MKDETQSPNELLDGNFRFRLLEEHELIQDGDRIALRRAEYNGGGFSCSFAVHQSFHGTPKAEAHFEIARAVG